MCVRICSVSDVPRALQRLHSPDLPGVVCLVSVADRCNVSSVRACVPVRGLLRAWSALHLARPALLPVLCSPSGCAGGLCLHRRGIWGEPGVGQVSPVTTEKIKKGSKNYPTPIVNLKNFPQKQKDPYKWSVFCAILALQALKGRNLQWLKVK